MLPLPDTVVVAGVIAEMSPLNVAESTVELALVIDTPEKDLGLAFFASDRVVGAVKVQTPPEDGDDPGLADGDDEGEAPGDAPGDALGLGFVVGLGYP